MSETDEDDVKTVLYTKSAWLQPVESVDDLPTEGVEEGTKVLVGPESGDEDQTYQFFGGAWICID